MKRARVGDLWREVRRAPCNRLRLSWEGVTGLPDGNVVVAGPIAVLCGENGAGKSTVVRLLHEALASISSRQIGIAVVPPPTHSTLHVAIQVPASVDWIAEPSRFSEALFADEQDAVIAFFDPSLQLAKVLQLIRDDANFGDLISGVQPKVASPSALERVSYIVGRDYEQIETFEINDLGEMPVFPYFRVRVGGAVYSSEGMGMGELSALTACWMAESLPRRSVLLIEELETFLAPNSQTALLNHLAECALERSLLVVITSHSGNIVGRISGACVVHVSRYLDRVTFVTDPGAAILSGRLGLVPEKRLLLLVEDIVAKYFCEALMEAGLRRLGGDHDYVICSGHTGITRILNAIPYSHLGAISLVGIYDGDVHRTELHDGDWPNLKLPDAVSPERVIRSFVTNLPAVGRTGELEVSEDSLAAALASAQGMDAHDWLHEVSRILGIHEAEFVRRVVRAIMRQDPNFANAFLRRLETLSLT